LQAFTGAQCIYNHAQPAFTNTFLPNAWQYLTLTWDSSVGTVSTFYDGVLAQTLPNNQFPFTFNDIIALGA
jgi:hypothetical protein